MTFKIGDIVIPKKETMNVYAYSNSKEMKYGVIIKIKPNGRLFSAECCMRNNRTLIFEDLSIDLFKLSNKFSLKQFSI